MKKQTFFDRLPLAYALRQSLKEGYRLRTFKQDVLAGLIVSLVALPLAMALAIAVGLPPQHGLYTAIVAGIAVPLLGGSITQVSGPTAAFVVIIAPIVVERGLPGLIITEILAGIILVALGLAKLGRYIHFVPYPVTTGFTSGIAVVIGTLALNDFLGLGIEHLTGDYIHKAALIIAHVPLLSWPETLVGMVSLAVMFTSPLVLPKVPSPVLGVAVGTLLAYILQQQGFDIATIGSRFTYLATDGTMGHGIPPFAPTFHWPAFDKGDLLAWHMSDIRALLLPAFIVAALAALESLLSATVADGIAGTKHQPNAELMAVGVGNILSGLASGIPATGAIARTATNIHSGARTPIASIIHAILILLYVLALAPALSYIPMAALAALLLSVAYRMSHYKQFFRTIQIAPRSDVIVLLVCFSLTVFIDMVAGVTAGVVLACFLFMRRIADLTQSDISHGHYNTKAHLPDLPDDTLVYHIRGSLFFGTVEKALDRTGFIQDHIRVLVIDMEHVPLIDMSGLVAMKTMIMDVLRKNRRIILCGQPDITHRILEKLPANLRPKVAVVKTLAETKKLVRSKSRK